MPLSWDCVTNQIHSTAHALLFIDLRYILPFIVTSFSRIYATFTIEIFRDELDLIKAVVLKYEMGNFGRNGQFLGERGRNGQLLGEMGMIDRDMT